MPRWVAVIFGLACLVVASFAVLIASPFLVAASHEKALARVISDRIGPGESTDYRVTCKGFECSTFYEELPTLESVDCTFLIPPPRSCCNAKFVDRTTLEVHVSDIREIKVPFKWKTRFDERGREVTDTD